MIFKPLTKGQARLELAKFDEYIRLMNEKQLKEIVERLKQVFNQP